MAIVLLVDGDPLMFRAAWKKSTVEEALKSWEERLEDLKNTTFCDEVKIAVFCSTNYRKDFFADYKNTPNRHKAKANNPFFTKLRDLLVERGLVTVATGMEADDLVRIWHEEENAKGNVTVIASVDKDLQCIASNHYLIHHDKMIHVDEETADTHYWTQVLTGDMVDNIRGLKGIGPKKAAAVLEGATTTEDRCQRVVDKFHEIHGENWEVEVKHTGTLIHILKTRDDWFTIHDCTPTALLTTEEQEDEC